MTEQFPIKATHKSFGEISITGIRTESNSNNNTMYQFRLNGELVWGYDYEITILSPLPHQDGASAEDVVKATIMGYVDPNKVAKISGELMRVFKSETAKVVAEKDREIAEKERLNDLHRITNEQLQYDLTAANERIKELEDAAIINEVFKTK